jgi:putative transposase
LYATGIVNTYTHTYIQAVFAVEDGNRSSHPYKDDIFKYIAGTLKEKGQKLMAINGMPDHFHLLIRMSPNIALSDLVKDVEAASSRLINDKKWVRGRFNWQAGFGAFSY